MISLALAGKPNAGKSTFYTAATMADVEVGNYPFTTIDANQGVSYARTRCPCLDRDSRCDSDNCADGKRYVPLELYDVAGLVPGAHEGRGLGNQFLDELTDADAILHVVDAAGATDEEGEPVEVGEHDPVEDVEDGVGVGEFVEELVAEAAALVGAGHEACDVVQFQGDVTLAVLAVVAVTAAVAVETGAARPGVAHPAVRVDGGERVVADLHVGHRGRGVEGGLAGVWLPREREREHGWAVFRSPTKHPFGFDFCRCG